MVNLEARPISVGRDILSRSELREVPIGAVYKFANMGLSRREISFAVEIETGIKVALEDIINLVYRARRVGTIRKLTPEEKTDIARTMANSWIYTNEVIRKDVESILQGIKELEARGEPLPQNRLELVKFRLPHTGSRPKEEGVKIGNKLVFLDGRYIPTFEGLSQSRKQRDATAERSRRPQSREWVTKRNTVWSKVKPLRERMALLGEIVEITGLTGQQVKRALNGNRFRSEWDRIPALTPEQVTEMRRRARKARKRKNQENRELPTQEERNSLVFARIIFDSGLISEDLKDWCELNSIYAVNKRDLPDSFAKCLRLEVFLSAIKQAKEGEAVLLGQYRDIGKSIDPEWFNFLVQEEGFIAAKLLTDWADGEDERGFFRLDGGGKKTRHTDIVEGVIVNDKSALTIRKLRIKAINGRNGNGNGKNGIPNPRLEELWGPQVSKRKVNKDVTEPGI